MRRRLADAVSRAAVLVGGGAALPHHRPPPPPRMPVHVRAASGAAAGPPSGGGNASRPPPSSSTPPPRAAPRPQPDATVAGRPDGWRTTPAGGGAPPRRAGGAPVAAAAALAAAAPRPAPVRAVRPPPPPPYAPPDISPEGKAALLAGGDAPTMREALLERGFALKHYGAGEQRLTCPRCGGGSDREQSLSLRINPDGQGAVWNCFRGTCGWAGGVALNDYKIRHAALGERAGAAKGAASIAPKKDVAPTKPSPKLEPLSSAMVAWFASRGISEATLERNGVAQEVVWSPAHKERRPSIAFPYTRNGEIVNVKYRTEDKHFTQVKGAEKILYGLDDVAGETEIIFVEGEMDKLALEEAGFTNVVSVPDGAPRDVKDGALPDPEDDTKFSYLWACRAVLDMAAKIVIATDNDGPGNALAEELARRLGRERCWRVKWPGADAPGGRRKDANEVLLADGADSLRSMVVAAEAYPIRGLFSFADFGNEIMASYVDQCTDVMGVSTGWQGLDNLYRIVPGELTIVTGIPNSGKSEWIDALLCNLSEAEGWSFALCSMEKKARDHARQLLEKHVKKPFFESARYADGKERMTPDEVSSGLTWLSERFVLIRYEDEELPSIDWVLDTARAAVMRFGIRGLVIDPYNELDHQRPPGVSETEYVSQMLTKIKRFAQHYDAHVWFVAHPRQLQQWRGDPPNLYDISGSAHFVNKADNGVVVHRVRDEGAAEASAAGKQVNDKVQVLVRKVRNKSAGTIGEAFLKYDRTTGRYDDLEPWEWPSGGSSHAAS